MTTTQTKTAIITGASGGIGRAVALRLARDGFAAHDHSMDIEAVRPGSRFVPNAGAAWRLSSAHVVAHAVAAPLGR